MKIVSMIQADVKQRQTNLRLQPGELITAQQLEQTPTVEQTSANIIRAVVVLVGVGIVGTVAFVIAVDAVLRRRARRRTVPWTPMPTVATAGAVGPPPPMPSIGTSYRSTAGRLSDETVIFQRVAPVEQPNITLPPLDSRREADSAPADRSAPVSAPVSPMPLPGESDRPGLGQRPGLGMNMQVDFQTVGHNDEADDEPAHEDATIVLPLSNAPSRRSTNGGRPSGAARP